jgi:hypothetical protein
VSFWFEFFKNAWCACFCTTAVESRKANGPQNAVCTTDGKTGSLFLCLCDVRKISRGRREKQDCLLVYRLIDSFIHALPFPLSFLSRP